MQVSFDLPDKLVKDFTPEAKQSLNSNAKNYITEVINEAKRVESATREDGATHQVTDSHVIQAVKRNKIGKKKKPKNIIIRIVAQILTLITGGLFMPNLIFGEDKTLGIWLAIGFIITLIASIILSIFSYFMEGE